MLEREVFEENRRAPKADDNLTMKQQIKQIEVVSTTRVHDWAHFYHREGDSHKQVPIIRCFSFDDCA